MRKYFKNNLKYFNYINKNKNKINVIEVKPIKNSIRLVYQKKTPDEIEAEQLELKINDKKEVAYGR